MIDDRNFKINIEIEIRKPFDSSIITLRKDNYWIESIDDLTDMIKNELKMLDELK